MKLRREIEETGEFEKLLGFNVQHIRVFLYMEPVPESCPQTVRLTSTLTQERDGWYIQVPSLPECHARKDQNASTNSSDGTLTPDLLPAKVEVKRAPRTAVAEVFTAAAGFNI